MNIKLLILEEILSNNSFIPYNIDTNLGSARILVGNSALRQTLKWAGYESLDEVETESEKKELIAYSKKIKPEIQLISWRSNKKGNGFGREVIRAIFDLGEKYNINKFTISLSSLDARAILNHYVESGNLKPIEDSKMGMSMDERYTEYSLIKKP